MSELFKWLSANPTAANVFLYLAATVISSFLILFLAAFFQGREISLWPPKIGPKPVKPPQKISDPAADPAAAKEGIGGGTYITSSIDRDLKGETAIDDIRNAQETIHVTHFTGHIPDEEYVETMLEVIKRKSIDTVRAIPADLQNREWLEKFEALSSCTERRVKTNLGFDILIIDRQKVRLYFPVTKDALEFKRVMVFDDKEVADCFMVVFDRIT